MPFDLLIRDIREELKTRFRAKQSRGKFLHVSFREYEERVYHYNPFLNPEDITHRRTWDGKRVRTTRRNL